MLPTARQPISAQQQPAKKPESRKKPEPEPDRRDASLAGPRRLSLPSFTRRYDAPAALPRLRVDVADRDALAAAEQVFARLSEPAHDAPAIS